MRSFYQSTGRMTERGLVISEFIRRFREDKPTPEKSRRARRSDFWWLNDDESTLTVQEKVGEDARSSANEVAGQRDSLLSLQLSSIGSFTPTTHSPRPLELVQSVESAGAPLPTEDACEEAYSRCHEILKQIRLPVASTALAGSDSPLDASWFSAGPISLGGSHSPEDDFSCQANDDNDVCSAPSAGLEEDHVLQESYSMDASGTAWESFLQEGRGCAHRAAAATGPLPVGPHPPTTAGPTDSAPGGAHRGGDGDDAESSVLFISPASSLQSCDFLVQARGAVAEAGHTGASASTSAAEDVDQPPSPPNGSELVRPVPIDAAERTQARESGSAPAHQGGVVRLAEEGAGKEAVLVSAAPAACVDEELVQPFLRDEALLELWGRLRGVRGKAAALRAVLAAAH